jgi:tetratricopeptide (TPR) repeat protein
LHRALETYRIPAKLVGVPTAVGPVPRRLTPIFRDRDELPASGNLGAELTAALRDSQFLVVLCSPAAARSRWVGEEVVTFKRMHGEERVLALVVDGRPGASAIAGQKALECFPKGVRFRLGADGEASGELAHPIAADMRGDKDGRQLAKLKLVAGLSGLRLDDLVQREAQRRARSLAAIAGTSLAGMVLTGALALYANQRRIEADEQRRIAQKETATARATSDYLIGTYKLINPATENPRSISALMLLSRGADRARSELADQPVVHARILQALGQAYNSLGLSQELVDMVGLSMPAIRRAGPDGAGALTQLAGAYSKLGKLDEALGSIGLAERALGSAGTSDPVPAADVAAMKGSILYSEGELPRGLASIDMALKLYRGAPESPPAKLAWAFRERGLILSDEGRFADADAALAESMDVYRRAFGDRHLATAAAWFAMAVNDLAAGRLELALQRIENALAIQRVVLDADNPTLADSYSIEGQVLQGQNKLAAAAAALTKAVSIYRKAFRRPHFQIGIALVYLAQVESDRGHTDVALADLDEAKHNYDVSYGKISANHGDLLIYRAKVLAKVGRRPEALADCAAGMKILDQTLGADASYTRTDAAICAKL